jgi:hypothetical protein
MKLGNSLNAEGFASLSPGQRPGLRQISEISYSEGVRELFQSFL